MNGNPLFSRKDIAKILLPLVLQNILTITIGMVDSIMVSGTAAQDVTTYGFTYDENGNITEICDSEGPSRGSITTTSSGSLSGKTTAHSEKLTSGHMITPETSKKTYAFTTGTLGSVQGTQSYTYDAWGNCTELGIVLYSST